jgi:ABC-type transport system involved in multi-copper enzyme maturation permease subunit
MVLLSSTRNMLSPSFGGVLPVFYWPLHCGIMLGASALIMGVSVMVVRRVALRQAVGEQRPLLPRRRWAGSSEVAKSGEKNRPSPIVRVAGRPVIWKEFRSPLLGRRRILTVGGLILGLIGLLVSYLACAATGGFLDDDVHQTYAVIYLGLGLLFSIVLPSTSITSEKESRSWPLLLATTLDEREILFGKFIGTLRRCVPVWFLLLGHVFLFGRTGLIHPIAILQIGILVIWVVAFLSGTGLYFSTVCTHTTTAVMMNFALAAFIWAILPLFIFIFLSAMQASDDLGEDYMDTNPFIQALVVMHATVGEGEEPDFNWPGASDMNAAESTVWMLTCAGVYGLLGFLFAWRAKCRLRRNVF